MTLVDMTGHTGGVIHYGGDSVAAMNWAGIDDEQMPILSPFGTMMFWPEEQGCFDGYTTERVEDWRKVLPGSVWLTDETDCNGVALVDTDMDIVFDQFGDIAAAFMGKQPDGHTVTEWTATVYTLQDGRRIICPHNWD